MSNFKIYHEDKGFIFMNGALTEVKLLYTNFLKRGENFSATTTFETWGEQRNKDANLLKVYRSVEDFEKDEEMPFMEICDEQLNNKRPNGFENVDWGWFFMNGEPNQVDLTPNELTYDYNSMKFRFPGHIANGDNVYRTRKECLLFNTYKVKDEWGEVKEHVGINKLLMLDDDQNQLLDAFVKSYKALLESGVSFLNNYDETRVFNIRNLQNYEVDYSTEDYEGYEKVDISNKAFECPVFLADNFFSDDATIFAERK